MVKSQLFSQKTLPLPSSLQEGLSWRMEKPFSQAETESGTWEKAA